MKKMNIIIKYGLYLLVFLLPIQTRWIIKVGELNGGYWEYGTISLYMTDVILIILLIFFIINKLKHKNSIFNIQNTNYWWFIAIIELMAFISIFTASDKIVAIYSYIRLLFGIGLFWLIVSADYSKIKLKICFITGIFLQAILGIWQFSSQSSFANKWLGVAMHNASDLGTSVVETLSGERWLRAYGGLDHPNILGGLLAVGILLLINLMINSKFQISNSPRALLRRQIGQGKQISLRLKKTKNKTQNSITFLFYYTFSAVILISIFYTFSRGAWVGLIVGLLTMLFITVIKKDLLKQKRLLEIILIMGIISFIFFNLYQNLVLARLSEDTRLEQKSNIERIASFKDARELIKNHWLLGVGIGNYTQAIQNKITANQPSWFYQPVHNVFLLVWAEIGILGLLALLGLLLWAVKNRKNLLSLSLTCGLVIMFLVDHYWWSLHFGTLLFWLIIGLVIGSTEKEKP